MRERERERERKAIKSSLFSLSSSHVLCVAMSFTIIISDAREVRLY